MHMHTHTHAHMHAWSFTNEARGEIYQRSLCEGKAIEFAVYAVCVCVCVCVFLCVFMCVFMCLFVNADAFVRQTWFLG